MNDSIMTHSNCAALKYVTQRRPRCVQRLSEESNDGFKRTLDNTLSDPLEFHLLRNVAKTPLLLVFCILSHGQFVESVLRYPSKSRIVIHHIEDVMCRGAVRLKVPLLFHLFLVEA